MKLNVGCGQHPLEGYVNIDGAGLAADFKCEFRDVAPRGQFDEVRADHVLEHQPWRETYAFLGHASSCLRDGGRLVIEVPNWDGLREMDPSLPLFQQWVFGEQSHGGEFHHAAFTVETLSDAIERAGFEVIEAEEFRSEHPARVGYPCVRVVAVKS